MVGWCCLFGYSVDIPCYILLSCNIDHKGRILMGDLNHAGSLWGIGRVDFDLCGERDNTRTRVP